jgi:hypothetical protein
MPGHGFVLVARDAAASRERDAELVLRRRMPGFGCGAQMRKGLLGLAERRRTRPRKARKRGSAGWAATAASQAARAAGMSSRAIDTPSTSAPGPKIAREG